MKAPFRIAVINDEITQGLPVPTKWRPTNLAEAGSKCGLWNKNIFKPEMAAGIDQVLWNTFGIMVARDGIEPPTPAFSGLRSTD